MEQARSFPMLNSLTCLALGKVAHIESMLELEISQAEALLQDITNIAEELAQGQAKAE